MVTRRRHLSALMLSVAAAATLASSSGTAALWPDVPDRIRTDLASPDVARRRTAASDLVHLPREESASLYRSALADPDVEVRLNAADGAGRRGVNEATDLVLPWLTDVDARLREGACEFFAKFPQPKVVKVLARSLGDTEPKVRLAAVRALGASGSSDAVAPILARLDDSNSKVRLGVARALARLGDRRAVTPLVSKVQDEASDVRQAVVRTLGELGDAKAAPALVIALRDAQIEVRIEALAALGRLRAADSVASIAPLSVEPNRKAGAADVRRAALAALGRIATSGAVDAIVRAFGQLEDATAGVAGSPARDAAVIAGGNAEAVLLPLLREGADPASSMSSWYAPAVAASAAWVLGELHAPGAGDAIVKAMRRGDVPPAVALHALAALGDSAQLPICLEHVASSDKAIRAEALTAAARLLDPENPDGRAVEPLLASLDVAQTPDDRAEIATLLGRTGAERVGPVLIGLTASKDEKLRVAAVDALGTLRAKGAGRTLVALLDDRSGAVRLRAGIALGRAGGAEVVQATLQKLTEGAETDRLAVVIAVGELLERLGDPASIAIAKRVASSGLGAERDLLVVALGRAKHAEALTALEEMSAGAGGDVDLRRAIAVAVGARASDARALLLVRSLTSDVDPTVRAQGAWSLGAVGDGSDFRRLDVLSRDSSLAVAANAVAALGRIAARASVLPAPVPSAVCRALSDDRPYVRANALGALLQLARAGKPASCGDGASERRLLTDDGSDVVRLAAARAMRARLGSAPPDVAAALRSALERCTLADPSGAVATTCREALRSSGAASSAAVRGTSTLIAFIAPDDGGAPLPRSAFAMERPDGLLHLGTSDRRGAVVELLLERGGVRLRVAAPPPTPAPLNSG